MSRLRLTTFITNQVFLFQNKRLQHSTFSFESLQIQFLFHSNSADFNEQRPESSFCGIGFLNLAFQKRFWLNFNSTNGRSNKVDIEWN